MAKKLLFDLEIDASATFASNASEFYTNALVGDEKGKRSTRYFRELLVMGESTKIGNLMAEDVIQENGCDFTSTDMDLSQKLISPEILSIGVEVCQWDIEASFISAYTKNVGAIDFMNTSGLNPELESHMLAEVGRTLSSNLEKLTFKGDKAGSTNTYLDFADGLNVKLQAGVGVNKIVGTTLSSANILAEIEKVYLAIPDALGMDVKIGVSTKAMRMYKLAVAKQNNVNYITASLADKMIDYDVVEFPGAEANDMYATILDKNFIYATDITRDPDLQVINMKATTGDRKYRIIGDFKFAVDFINPTEIVFYSPNAVIS